MHIGAYSYVAFDAAILTHDRARSMYSHTRISQNCFIGTRSIILPASRSATIAWLERAAW